MNEYTKWDAEEFGALIRHGGWHLGLRVARNVQRGKPTNKKKVSVAAFAQQAGVNAGKVSGYLTAWERAADDKLVPYADELAPGDEVGLPDNDEHPWSHYYTVADSMAHPSRAAIEAEADRSGVGRTTPLTVARNKAAMAVAIRADAEVAEAAIKALGERHIAESAKKGRLPSAPVEESDGHGLLTRINIGAEYTHATHLIHKLLKAIREATPLDDGAREMYLERQASLEAAVAWLRSFLETGDTSWDDALQNLLGDAR